MVAANFTFVPRARCFTTLVLGLPAWRKEEEEHAASAVRRTGAGEKGRTYFSGGTEITVFDEAGC